MPANGSVKFSQMTSHYPQVAHAQLLSAGKTLALVTPEQFKALKETQSLGTLGMILHGILACYPNTHHNIHIIDSLFF